MSRRDESKARIRTAIKELLSRAGVSEPPVDLERVAMSQGVEVIDRRRMGTTFGILSRQSGKLTITLNDRYPERSRFTLAHEIAHTMVELRRDLRSENVVLAMRAGGGNDLERLCDEIGTELLFPTDMFKSALGEAVPTIQRISRLAGVFHGSLRSTAMRTGELSLRPVEVLYWERKERSSRLRVVMRRGSPFLTRQGASRERNLKDRSSAIVTAYDSQEKKVGIEVPMPELPYSTFRCEAKGFGAGSRRFILSVVTPVN